MIVDCECAAYQLITPDFNAATGLPEPSSVQTSSFMFSAGIEPGAPIVMSVLQGRSGIGSQIALKMSADCFIDCAERVADRHAQAGKELVRSAFREANQTVYEYAHRMGQAGNFAATGVFAALDDQELSIASVGSHTAFIARPSGEGIQVRQLVPSSSNSPSDKTTRREGTLERFIGANAKILVDAASTAVQPGDTVLVTNASSTTWMPELVTQVLKGFHSPREWAKRLATEIIRQTSVSPTERISRHVVVLVVHIRSEDAPILLLKPETIVE